MVQPNGTIENIQRMEQLFVWQGNKKLPFGVRPDIREELPFVS